MSTMKTQQVARQKGETMTLRIHDALVSELVPVYHMAPLWTPITSGCKFTRGMLRQLNDLIWLGCKRDSECKKV